MSPKTLASSQTSFVEDEEAGELFLQDLPAAASSLGKEDDYAYQGEHFILEDDPAVLQQYSVEQEPELPPAVIEDDMFEMQEDGSLVMREPSSRLRSDDVAGFQPAGLDLPIENYNLDLGLDEDSEDLPVSFHVAFRI